MKISTKGRYALVIMLDLAKKYKLEFGLSRSLIDWFP